MLKNGIFNRTFTNLYILFFLFRFFFSQAHAQLLVHGLPLPLPKTIMFQTKSNVLHVVNVIAPVVNVLAKKDLPVLRANVVHAQMHVTDTVLANPLHKLLTISHTTLMMEPPLLCLLFQTVTMIVITVLVPKIPVPNTTTLGTHNAHKDVNVMLDTVAQTVL